MIEKDLYPILRLIENLHIYLQDTIACSGQVESSSHSTVTCCKNYATEVNRRLLEIQDLTIEERPLQIGLVGGFSTGKSSVINSLLGRELLGVEVTPTTAKPTEICYGNRLKIEKVMVGGTIEEIDLESFSEMSNHLPEGPTSGFEEISSFRLEYPSNNLKRFSIIDTPGFFSISKKDDELTLKQMDRMDLFLWVFDLENPGKKEEVDLLKKISSKKIIGVINKCEGKPPEGREKQKKELLKVFPDFDSILFYSSKRVLKFQMEQRQQVEDLKVLKDNIKKYTNEGTAIFSFTKIGYCINEDIAEQFSLKFLKENEFFCYYLELISKIEEIARDEKDELFKKSREEKEKKLRDFIGNILIDLNSQTEELLKKTNRIMFIRKKKEQDFLKDLQISKDQLKLQLENHYRRFVPFLSINLFNGFFRPATSKGLFGENIHLVNKGSNDAMKFMQDISIRFLNKCMKRSEDLLKINGITATVNHELKEYQIKNLKITGDFFCRTLHEQHFKDDKYPSKKTKELKELIKTVLPNEEIKKLIIEFTLDHFIRAYHFHYKTNHEQLKRIEKNLSIMVQLKHELENHSYEWENLKT